VQQTIFYQNTQPAKSLLIKKAYFFNFPNDVFYAAFAICSKYRVGLDYNKKLYIFLRDKSRLVVSEWWLVDSG